MLITTKHPEAKRIHIVDENGNEVKYVFEFNTVTKEAVVADIRESVGRAEYDPITKGIKVKTIILSNCKAMLDGKELT